jgi:hypothetical protein
MWFMQALGSGLVSKLAVNWEQPQGLPHRLGRRVVSLSPREYSFHR